MDWKGLFEWSANYNDGTEKSQFTEMRKEDREWLEKAMEEYTFDEVQKMKDIIMVLCDHQAKGKDELVDTLLDLEDLIDAHQRNSLNFDLLGGFKILIDVMFNNTHEEVRRSWLIIFSLIVQNNVELQEVAFKYGGMNLMYQFWKEDSIKNKEHVIGALSCFIRTVSHEIKNEFIEKMNGLEWLRQIIIHKNTSNRTLKKIYFVLYDFTVNEDAKVFEDESELTTRWKDFIVQNSDMIDEMINTLKYDDEKQFISNHALHESILNVLAVLAKYKVEWISEINFKSLMKNIDQIESILSKVTDPDTLEFLTKELNLTKEITK